MMDQLPSKWLTRSSNDIIVSEDGLSLERTSDLDSMAVMANNNFPVSNDFII